MGCNNKEDRDGWIEAINNTAHGSLIQGESESPSGQEVTAFGHKVTKEDFELVGVIGQGSFAKVTRGVVRGS